MWLISLTECNSGTTQKCPFGVNNTTKVINITMTSNNEQHLTEYVKLTNVPLLSHVIIFLDMLRPTINTTLHLFYNFNLIEYILLHTAQQRNNAKFSVGYDIYFLLEI